MPDNLDRFEIAYGSIHGYLASTVCVLGILGNIANIVVLSRPKMIVSPINFLLMMIAIAASALMLTNLPQAIYFHILRDPQLEPYFVRSRASARYLYFCLSFVVVCHSIAVWHTIAVATFRWLTLGVNNGKSYCSMRNAYICSAVIIIGNGALSIPNWVVNEIVEVPHAPCYVDGEIRHMENETVYTVYARADTNFNMALYACFSKILPCILLTGLTIMLLMIMRKVERKRQQLLYKGKCEESRRHQEHNRTTGMLLAVVVIFLIVELPHGIFIIVVTSDINHLYARIYFALGEMIDIITLISFSVNFIFYTIMSRQFRTTFFRLFCQVGQTRSHSFHRFSSMMNSMKTSMSAQRSPKGSNQCISEWHSLTAADYTHPTSRPLLDSETTGTTILTDNNNTNSMDSSAVSPTPSAAGSPKGSISDVTL